MTLLFGVAQFLKQGHCRMTSTRVLSNTDCVMKFTGKPGPRKKKVQAGAKIVAP